MKTAIVGCFGRASKGKTTQQDEERRGRNRVSFVLGLTMSYDFVAVQLQSEGNCNDSWPPRIQDDKITRVDEQGLS